MGDLHFLVLVSRIRGCERGVSAPGYILCPSPLYPSVGVR